MSQSLFYNPTFGGGGGQAGNVYLSTGIIEGLDLIGLTGGNTFSIGAGSYQVINMADLTNITFDNFVVGAGDFVNIPIPNIATQDLTYVFLNNVGGVFTKNTLPTLDDVTNLVYLGNLSHEGGAVLTTDATDLGWVAYNTILELARRDFVEGTKRFFGLEFDFVGNGSAPDLSAGETFRLGSNRINDPTKPHEISIGASKYGSQIGNFVTFNVISDGATGIIVNLENSIDFLNYDGGAGVLVPVGNNNYANHYFWLFPNANGGYFLFHEFGKQNYTFLSDAVVGRTTENHFDFLDEAAYIGVISARNNVVDIDLAIIAGDAEYFGGNSIGSIYRI